MAFQSYYLFKQETFVILFQITFLAGLFQVGSEEGANTRERVYIKFIFPEDVNLVSHISLVTG